MACAACSVRPRIGTYVRVRDRPKPLTPISSGCTSATVTSPTPAQLQLVVSLTRLPRHHRRVRGRDGPHRAHPTARHRKRPRPRMRPRLLPAGSAGPISSPRRDPGRKHERPIVLADWQRELVDATRALHPRADPLRRLPHDQPLQDEAAERPRRGVRVSALLLLQPVGRHPRAVLRDLRRLGVRWTQSNHRNISISHRTASRCSTNTSGRSSARFARAPPLRGRARGARRGGARAAGAWPRRPRSSSAWLRARSMTSRRRAPLMRLRPIARVLAAGLQDQDVACPPRAACGPRGRGAGRRRRASAPRSGRPASRRRPGRATTSGSGR